MTDSKVNYEYNDLRDRIQNKLRSKEGWGDSYESSVGQTLIDIAADAADNLAYMLERRSQENFQSTARLRTSVTTRSSENGYRSRRAIAAGGMLRLTLTDDEGNPKIVPEGGVVTIPEGTPITFDGENFFTTGESEILAGFSDVDIRVSEGVLETITFDPNTDPNFLAGGYVLIPDYEYIDEFSIVVTSSSIEYEDVKVINSSDGIGIGALSFSGAVDVNDAKSAAFYDIRYGHDGMRIQFGDNIFGRRPTELITVRFVRSRGASVRVISLDNEFRFDFNTFGDGINVTPPNEYQYTLKNVTQIVGGRDPETIDEIRTVSPLFITTNNRAVSLTGYAYWARRSNIGGIIDARAYGEAELDTLMYNLNNVYISYLTESGDDLAPHQKQELIDFLKARDVALAHIVPSTSPEIQLGLEIKVKKIPGVQVIEDDLYTIIREFLINYFRRQAGSIGRGYQKSDLIRDFYNLRTRIGGANYDLIDFVDISIHAYQPAVYFDKVNSVIVSLDLPNDPSVGDTFTITFDGYDYTVEVESSDLSSGEPYLNILYKMRDKVYAETNIVPEVSLNEEDRYVLHLRSRDNLGGFVVQTNAEDDLAEHATIQFNMQIHPKHFNNEFEDIILRNHVYIVDENGNQYFHDDGEGRWVNSNTNEVSSSTMIDYITGLITLPDAPNENEFFYVKYKQDEFDNFTPNSAATVTLIAPTEHYIDVGQTFSTITILPDGVI